MSVMVDQSHRNIGVGVAVITIGGECLACSLYWLISMVGVEVRVDIGDIGTSEDGGGSGDRSETPVQLLLHSMGERVDITEGEVAVGAEI